MIESLECIRCGRRLDIKLGTQRCRCGETYHFTKSYLEDKGHRDDKPSTGQKHP